MTQSRVFVVQQPAFFDKTKRSFIPKYSLNAADDYGEVIHLLPPGNVFKDKVSTASRILRDRLSDFSAADYLLAIGDPVAIALAAIIAGERTGGHIRMLKWDRIKGTYIAFDISAFASVSEAPI